MKKILSIILAAALMTGMFAVFSNAAVSGNAKFVLSASVGGKNYSSGDTISVAPGSTVEVKVAFTSDFYIAGVAAQVFYDSNIFTGATNAFNKDGKLYNTCGASMCTFSDWSGIAAMNQKNWWPDYSADKLSKFKENHKFCYWTMTANIGYGEPAVKVNGDVVTTLKFKVSDSAKSGATGQILIPAESAHRKDYKNGRTMCSMFENSSMSSKRTEDVFKYDMSKAVLNFKVSGSSSSVTLGDVNADGNINSVDALWVLQTSVGSKTLNTAQKTAADVNKDGSINSNDALYILRYAVGEIKSF